MKLSSCFAHLTGTVVTLAMVVACGGGEGSPDPQVAPAQVAPAQVAAASQPLAPSDAVSGTGVAAQLQSVNSLQCLIFNTACDQPAGAAAGTITQVQNCTVPAGADSCTAIVTYFTARATNPLLVLNGTTVSTAASSLSFSVVVPAAGGDLLLKDGANVLDQKHVAPTVVVPPPTATLSVSKAGTGAGAVTSLPSGIACGSTCSASYAGGSQVTLTASPDNDSTFAGWSGACAGTASCAVTMNSDKAVVASFAHKAVSIFTLTTFTGGTGNGDIRAVPTGTSCGTGCMTYPVGAVVLLTAIPDGSSNFSNWSGACSGTGCVVTMTSNQSVTANFTYTGGN